MCQEEIGDGDSMNDYDAKNPIHAFIGSNHELLDVYRKAGYDRLIDEQTSESAKNLLKLTNDRSEVIEKSSEIYQLILQFVGAKEGVEIPKGKDIHKRYDFEDELQRFQSSNPEEVEFIMTFFRNLDQLESCYKAQWNPLPQSLKDEMLEKLSVIKDDFFEGRGGAVETEVYNLLEEEVRWAFDPEVNEVLSEFFGKKREEFESVIYAMIDYREWRQKTQRDRKNWEDNTREALMKAAKLYVESPWMHCSFLTVNLLSSILGIYTTSLQDGRDEFQFIGGKLETILIVSFIIAYFFPILSIVSGFLALWVGYLYYGWWKSEKKLTKLNNVSSEIFTGGYDGKEMGKRLHSIEEGGIDIPSIVYPLLELHHKPTRDFMGRY